ncbi:hypothetical protein BpHYR1_006770 [Brachionus plicatilis]|uniref:Uncharacterized protein n=1 Tax=Brachionus plicatilis TaxID=10195 RepID=A0A3M7SYC0_BRAPC|nr:hypothetical protein BpHYR1_006770 [Brachionus plicatilis]
MNSRNEFHRLQRTPNDDLTSVCDVAIGKGSWFTTFLNFVFSCQLIDIIIKNFLKLLTINVNFKLTPVITAIKSKCYQLIFKKLKNCMDTVLIFFINPNQNEMFYLIYQSNINQMENIVDLLELRAFSFVMPIAQFERKAINNRKCSCSLSGMIYPSQLEVAY